MAKGDTTRIIIGGKEIIKEDMGNGSFKYTPVNNATVKDLEFDYTPPIPKSREGAILRYPYEALTDKTDYLQIDIRAYNSVATLNKNSLVSDGRSVRKNDPFNPVLGMKNPDTFFVGDGDNVATLKDINPFKKTRLKSGQGSILLPMPSNIQDGNSVSFADGNLDGITAAAFDVARTSMGIGTKTTDIQKNLTSAVTELGNSFLKDGSDFKDIVLAGLAAQAANIPLSGSLTRDAVFARTNGEILNQNVELLFNGVTLRSFKFSFKFTPRGPKEAQQVGLIINTFKRNMAAKVGQDATFLGTPNVFELTYKRGASSHPFLHSFKQCVLTDMSVNYTGEGTYAVYDDSTPVSMILELGFKELEPIYSEDYETPEGVPGLPGVGY